MLIIMFFFISFFFFFVDFFFFFFSVSFFFFFLFFIYFNFMDGYFTADIFSYFMIFISFWVFILSIFLLSKSILGFIFFWGMGYFVVLSFLSSSFILFYMVFELVFVLMFYFLLNWGSSFERIQASFYMFFYTLFFSLPFLMMLLDFMQCYTSFFFFYHIYTTTPILWVFTFFVFMVKFPIFGVHVWLPKAHVEASVSGSMLLAGVLLKLGGYGLYRFLFLLKNLSFLSFFFSFVFLLGLWGGLVSCFICYRQMDLKMLIAYSSVVHMSSALLGILIFSANGLIGSLLMMLSHGFISPLLFFLMTKIYSVSMSRSVAVLKGMLVLNSLFCLFWFFGSFLNLGVPPFMSFFSEVFIFGSMLSMSFYEWFVIFFILVSSGVYSVYLFCFSYHGGSIFFLFLCMQSKDYLFSFLMVFYVIIYFVLFLFPYQ